MKIALEFYKISIWNWFRAFGYSSCFSLSTIVLDKHYRNNMPRLVIAPLKAGSEPKQKKHGFSAATYRILEPVPNFVIKIVDKDGARQHAWRQSVQDVTTASV
ncbi:unnamed protein product [Eruca vesicaria subsp. sativa]|uniref:Uncharacterized protein n=1 Tax=Eruca vesicaria subsp. sativa TaxID=29727 RepID=A0ABC8JDY3_ERUVS|nr:unnamed protein product [Eruca vesicaria subsp. sativa]